MRGLGHLLVLGLVLQVVALLLTGWTLVTLFWWTMIGLGTSGLLLALLWGLARWTPLGHSRTCSEEIP